MKLPARNVVWLLPLCLTACIHIPTSFHRTKATQVEPLAPSTEDSKPPRPTPLHVELPPSVTVIPSQPAPPDSKAQVQLDPPKPRAKHRKPPPNVPAEQAQVVTENPGVSAIGQLSSGGAADLGQETLSSITATERGVNGINRYLNDQEKKTVTQIREFLRQARTALSSGDVDGAHTLAAKAKVLWGEINQ